MRSAFSLVELSIVLVILGLLTGGILTGQNLIRAAELRAVTTEFQSYQTAVMTFRDKYFALPGDMRNAEDFWGTMATGTCPNATAGTGTQTCNGNGDGQIDAANAVSQTGEMFGFWKHLANAGLIEGTYDGIAGASSVIHAVTGTNVPDSKMGNAGWTAFWVGSIDNTHTTVYEGEYSNVFYFGIDNGSGTTNNPALSPEEAWNIDTKVDDGQAGIGLVRMFESHGRSDGTGCTDVASSNSSALANSAGYELTNTSIVCAIVFANIY